MRKKILLIVFTGVLFNMINAQEVLHKYIDPMIGSEGTGRVFIGPSCPYGMVKPSPDCTVSPNSGWLPMPKEVTGFSQVHVSGTGGGPKYGNIQVMPFSGTLDKIDQTSFRAEENVKLGYYETVFKENNIKTEITTGEKVAFYRITYPKAASKEFKIDPGFFLGEKEIPNSRESQQFVGSEIEIISDTEVRGYSRIRGGWNNGPAYTVFFWAEFDQPIAKYVTWKNGKLVANEPLQFDSSEKTGALLSFGNKGNKTLNVKIGISYLSSSKAKNNIKVEIPHWDFNKVLSSLENKWEKIIKRITIAEDTSEEYKKMFYTGLYHTMLMPVDRSGENPLWNEVPYYDDFYCIWDTFRTSSPLITLIDPEREVEIVNAMLNIYKRDGYLPEGRSGNANGRTQGGSNAEVVLADAFVKKLKGIDYELALQAMLKDAEVPPGGNEEAEGRGGLNEYLSLGYIPYGIPRAGNRTIDYAYNDYNIATVAKGLGYNDIYERYMKQSSYWENLWRDNYEDEGFKGFIMPKDEDGNWLDDIVFGTSKIQKPTFKYTTHVKESPWYVCHWCVFFYEGDSWEYSFSLPHDIPKIIKKSGGNEVFKNRLNTFFDKDLYNVANEPSFLTPTLYHWIGRPDLSSDRIGEIIRNNFNATNFGLPGNDDSGAMSSWLAFHMMGLYPNAGQPYYLINTPMLEETKIEVQKGVYFKISTKNLSAKNRYIKQAYLNGKPYDKAWIMHEDIVKGGELIFTMSAKPSAWGTTILPPKKI
ncbi:alpha-mannosidase [Polaribacter reichenbachii]|uniref:Alpha-mannosidase n=1 Tax=Polaribacter reichenbachii TaxID=996801 RepID=A0A1B8U1J9_9FLAO|nr:GH92 family glycosyl hydrolase [Polaribacter reichenbachii]APZ47331.1 alpha-mannosidase [Polaribacter reichenbachii]AUC17972.1 alpha-mannosidase [Polaribacter reichenbachii]OBY65701.1 alpha-mannosidase [Polaribacter reichenbachii]